ncbi:hypothetical protein H696_03784 [Fonticula alba]|uniref:carbonic anhydrase n=1 Tax=Fonticula alba TaxID=691883 RepID=A0A058Z749_FONAL|nr:hypothetical protein H696_03784 [Fonticula alba]KCV69352.1 hypothetical protein H696_03784 [Fonticula alba]|eukprot:XP_009495917.1 hypothetical protein H696_03784 [Fonticula alba]
MGLSNKSPGPIWYDYSDVTLEVIFDLLAGKGDPPTCLTTASNDPPPTDSPTADQETAPASPNTSHPNADGVEDVALEKAGSSGLPPAAPSTRSSALGDFLEDILFDRSKPKTALPIGASPGEGSSDPPPAPERKKNFQDLEAGNTQWVKVLKEKGSEYFLIRGDQKPNFLWIGCCDSRTPAILITKQQLGQIFEMRSIANVFQSSCMSSMSALEYAVNALQVENIVVCCHSNCGGIRAALKKDGPPLGGVLDFYLEPLRAQLYSDKHVLAAVEASEKAPESIKHDSEGIAEATAVISNVLEQAKSLARSVTVKNAWKDPTRELNIHCVMYNLSTGKMVVSKDVLRNPNCPKA